MTRLYRSEEDRILGGVCGGIAEIYDLDPSLVRLATLLLILGAAPAVLYLAAWLIIPPKSEVVEEEEQFEAEDVKNQESVEEGSGE